MLKCDAVTAGNRIHAVGVSGIHLRGARRGYPTNSPLRSTSLISLQTWRQCGESNLGLEGDADEAMKTPRADSLETAGASKPKAVAPVERCDEAAQEGRVAAGECNAGGACAQDGREKQEWWEFLQHLPHKLQRDIGYTIVGPSLLSSSPELPIVSTSMLGGSSAQWASTRAWLQHLSIPALEAWFASHRPSQRLGDHFALCIEYVLRHAPHVGVQQLRTSQQVLHRVTEPVRSSRALKALESKRIRTAMLVEPVPLQDEQQQVSSEHKPTSLGESTQALEAMDLHDEEKVGKRKRKLLKRLERLRLQKGKTTTVGEFDFLFQIPLHGKEFHHWEVSVKYLLYAGPWEVFGLRSPSGATWRNPGTEDNDLHFEGDGGVSDEYGDGGSEETRIAAADLDSREVDNFLGCYLGPHVGETLLDRKARLRNQLALSAHPCAALMLQELYVNNGGSDEAGEERTKHLTDIPVAFTQVLDPSTVSEEDSAGVRILDGAEDLVVVPSAVLKGYLFYEYKLWRFLEGASVATQDESMKRDEIACLENRVPQLAEKASLKSDHSTGWWTRDIMEFGALPVHERSKWYIVPKLEWLSPVVIPESDTDRCARVLSLPDFVLTAAHVADEAARLLMPRKRRFLVAEVRWISDWEPCQGSGEKPATMGAWLEVSRGFVVENTWPDSRMYRPHGYVVSQFTGAAYGRARNVSTY